MITVTAGYTSSEYGYAEPTETTLHFNTRSEYEVWAKYAPATGITINSVVDNSPCAERKPTPHIFDGVDLGAIPLVWKHNLFATRQNLPGDKWGFVACYVSHHGDKVKYSPVTTKEAQIPFFASVEAAWELVEELLEKTGKPEGSMSVIPFEHTTENRCKDCGRREEPGGFTCFHAAWSGSRCDACAEEWGCECDCFDTDKD